MNPNDINRPSSSILVPYKYKSPVATALMSAIIPGLGQLNNGQYLKGFIILILSPLIIPYFIGIWDAYYSAKYIYNMRDRFLLKTILDALEEKTDLVKVVQQVSSMAGAAPPEDSLSETNFKLKEWETRMIVGGVIAGIGLMAHIISFRFYNSTSLLLLGFGFLLVGIAIIAWNWKSLKELKLRNQKDELGHIEKIASIVERYKTGAISVNDLVSITNLEHGEAEDILNKFVSKGYASTQWSKNNTREYLFSVR